ncbi:cytochrome c biogenesis CcdA family protein [Protofrankia symbiont of Coriaria ruscifolia]|uniref:cytochrome c biogenesis CcdA family protein n=1 Tax=Protofrankia symbiont of Coriaria ruscifolia TaxID=1306542 RepID=UPI001041156C|nr:cytochrome c biogenesis protein CcdA [Protofrankia symbiont of Coriaria ruscifolia]
MSVTSFVADGPLLLAAPVAAAAGLLSFLSPCVLPLVPGYLSFVTGLSGEELAARPVVGAGASPLVAGASLLPAGASPLPAGGRLAGSRPASSTGISISSRARHRLLGRVTLGTALFVVGFTAVFVSYGAAFGGLGRWLTLHQVGVSRILGSVTIVMGLAFAGLFVRLPLANREWRIHRLPAPGLIGAPALGVLFGIGWTPCLGPTLAAVLGLAVQSATAGRGAFLSAVYCFGLGVPFLVVGLAFRQVAGALAAARRRARALTFAGGLLLVAVGLLQVTGAWTDLIASLRPYVPGFAETPL